MPRDMTGACRNKAQPRDGAGWRSRRPRGKAEARSRRTGTGRFPPQPRFQPYAFYSCVRLGDSEQLKLARRPCGGCVCAPKH